MWTSAVGRVAPPPRQAQPRDRHKATAGLSRAARATARSGVRRRVRRRHRWMKRLISRFLGISPGRTRLAVFQCSDCRFAPSPAQSGSSPLVSTTDNVLPGAHVSCISSSGSSCYCYGVCLSYILSEVALLYCFVHPRRVHRHLHNQSAY